MFIRVFLYDATEKLNKHFGQPIVVIATFSYHLDASWNFLFLQRVRHTEQLSTHTWTFDLAPQVRRLAGLVSPL